MPTGYVLCTFLNDCVAKRFFKLSCISQKFTCFLMPSSHRRQGQYKTVSSCLVGGVNRIGDKSRLFSVVLTAVRHWTKQFWNFLSPTVLTCCHYSVHTTDKTRQSCRRCECIIYSLGHIGLEHFTSCINCNSFKRHLNIVLFTGAYTGYIEPYSYFVSFPLVLCFFRLVSSWLYVSRLTMKRTIKTHLNWPPFLSVSSQ